MSRPRALPFSAAILLAVVATFSWSTGAQAYPTDVRDGTAIPGAANTREEATPQELRDVAIDEKMDAQVPLDAVFKDENDHTVRLGDLFDGKRPTLLTLAYFSCPTLCSLVLSSEADTLVKTAWTAGKEFDVVTISIDPRETAEKTRDKKAALLAQYGRPEASTGWHFLRGDDATIHRVADSVGFRYKYDEEGKQYGHPAALILLKPNGRVSRYLYGIEFPPADLKIGLLEASEGKSISAVDQVILFCYRYDKTEGKYVLIAGRVMRIGGGFFALLLATFLAVHWRRERRRSSDATFEHDVTTRDTTRDDAPIVPMENHT